MHEDISRIRGPNWAWPSGLHGPFKIKTHEAGTFTLEAHFREPKLDIGAFFQAGGKNLCTISISVRYAGSLPDAKNQDDPLQIGAMDNPRDVQAVHGHVSRLIGNHSRKCRTRGCGVRVSDIEVYGGYARLGDAATWQADVRALSIRHRFRRIIRARAQSQRGATRLQIRESTRRCEAADGLH